MFGGYERLLDSIGSEDYWTDVGVDIAASKISQFDSSNWKNLNLLFLQSLKSGEVGARSLSETRMIKESCVSY